MGGEQGVLHVNCPFCAGFMECQILLPFLERACLPKPGIASVAVFGTDCAHMQGGKWDRKEKYVAKKYRQLTLALRQLDLTCDQLPECGLALGIHPEATRGGFWRDILASVVRSIKCGGVCVFACYFEVEAHAVIDKCKPFGIEFEVHENPYYKMHAVDMSPSLRFFVVGRVTRLLA